MWLDRVSHLRGGLMQQKQGMDLMMVIQAHIHLLRHQRLSLLHAHRDPRRKLTGYSEGD